MKNCFTNKNIDFNQCQVRHDNVDIEQVKYLKFKLVLFAYKTNSFLFTFTFYNQMKMSRIH